MTEQQAALMLELLEKILRAVDPPKYVYVSAPLPLPKHWDGLPEDWKLTVRD